MKGDDTVNRTQLHFYMLYIKHNYMAFPIEDIVTFGARVHLFRSEKNGIEQPAKC